MANRIQCLDKKIIASAKKAFLRDGYVGASLRQIAKDAGTSTSSIYTRFHNKEGLFCSIVEPIASDFVERIRKEFGNKENTEVWDDSFQQNFWMRQMDFIYCHRDEFCLLLISSTHTKYSSYLNTLATLAGQLTYSCKSEQLERKGIDMEFVFFIYISLFTGIFEIVLHHLKREDAAWYITKLCHYFGAGWQSILYINS